MKAAQKGAVDAHHLWQKKGVWHIRFKAPEHLGGRRIAVSTHTNDVHEAMAVRDRVLGPILREENAADVARNVLAAIQSSDSNLRAMVDHMTASSNALVPTGPTLSVAAKRFLENRQNFKGRSGHTIDDYRRTLNGLQTIIGNVRVVQISAKDIRAFRDRLVTSGTYRIRSKEEDLRAKKGERPLAPRTVVKHVKNIRTFFNWAMKEELVEKNPAANVDLPTVNRNPIMPPSYDLADALCSVPMPDDCSVVGALDWEVLPWFYRFTGARCGEICRLTVEDIVQVDGIRCMKIFTEKTGMRGAGTRGDAKRLVPVHSKLAPHLDRLLAERGKDPEASLFSEAGTRVSPCKTYTRFGSAWANLYNKLSKPIWSKMKVHAWRSYAISEMATHGIPEEVRRRVVGHAVMGVHDGYTHFNAAKLKEAIETIR